MAIVVSVVKGDWGSRKGSEIGGLDGYGVVQWGRLRPRVTSLATGYSWYNNISPCINEK